jgi:hypothetical protein
MESCYKGKQFDVCRRRGAVHSRDKDEILSVRSTRVLLTGLMVRGI